MAIRKEEEEEEEYIVLLEKHVLELADLLEEGIFDGRKHSDESKKKSYSKWEVECDRCIDLLEGQCAPLSGYCEYYGEIDPKLLIGDPQSRTVRIARREAKRKLLRRHYVTSVPALSTNTRVNSIVQAIHGREIGFKKSHTKKLYDCLFTHNMYLSPLDFFDWRVHHFHVTELNPGCNEAWFEGYTLCKF